MHALTMNPFKELPCHFLLASYTWPVVLIRLAYACAGCIVHVYVYVCAFLFVYSYAQVCVVAATVYDYIQL